MAGCGEQEQMAPVWQDDPLAAGLVPLKLPPPAPPSHTPTPAPPPHADTAAQGRARAEGGEVAEGARAGARREARFGARAGPQAAAMQRQV